jgi:hypothetical protein
MTRKTSRNWFTLQVRSTSLHVRFPGLEPYKLPVEINKEDDTEEETEEETMSVEAVT